MNTMGAAVLVVEDDDLIASSLGRALRTAGYTVHSAGSLVAARRALLDETIDLVLCDLALPDGDGLDLVSELRRDQPGLPVVALTARSEEGDVVAGLAAGAIDYVTKPFRLAELQARIAAQLRRRDAVGSSPDDAVIEVGDLRLDAPARRVFVADREVQLRPREFELLVRLGAEAGKVVSREELMRDVWDEHWWGSTKTLDVHINTLRRKLGEAPGMPSCITTIRGVGYRLESP